jgi:GMP synthase-like glutamine amidotransferase
MHIAILVSNTDESAFAKGWPDDGAKFAALLQGVRPDWQVTGFAVTKGGFPHDINGFDGLIVTGSPASVHDPDPWVARLLALIRTAVAQGVPLFGACFGHQAVGLALGGEVGANPGGWVLGTVQTDLEGAQVRLYAAHREQVVKAPPGAVVVGRTPGCEVAAMRIGMGVLTTQYHPEMTHGFITALVGELDGKLPASVIAAARASLVDKAEAARIAEVIAAFFEGQDSAAKRSIAVT